MHGTNFALYRELLLSVCIDHLYYGIWCYYMVLVGIQTSIIIL